MIDQLMVLVNTIEVASERQRLLTDLLRDGLEEVIRHRPGFVSGTILASLDGTRVISCAVWQRLEDIEATRQDPASVAYTTRILALATPSPVVYRVVADIR